MRYPETSDSYPRVVVDFGDGWRVIECAAGLQWIVQRRLRNTTRPWEAQSFCRTKEALLRCAMHSHPVLDALPDRFPEVPETTGEAGQSDFHLLRA